MKVVTELSGNIHTIEGLERFQHKDKNGKDWGLNVRQRAKELRSLVTNPEQIRRERLKVQTSMHETLQAYSTALVLSLYYQAGPSQLPF